MAPRMFGMTRSDFLGGMIGVAAISSLPASARVLAGSPETHNVFVPFQFPKDFNWGVATASYQIEGAWDADGKGESIWDRFSHTVGKVKGADTGDVACDSYHRYKEDVELAKTLNVKSYRFSISWPRIQSNGTGQPNPKGLDYYKRVADELHKANIRPLATLYHCADVSNPLRPDLVVVILDASNLKRNLLLYTQVADLKIPVIIALNMMDLAKKGGMTIDVDVFAQRLGYPWFRYLREG